METQIALDEYAIKWATDKSSLAHGYTRWYEQYLGPRRDEKLTLLELGIGGHEDAEKGGASLRMWRNYFPNATIVGIDNEPKNFTIDGVDMHICSQDNEDGLFSLALMYQGFDVVIDDASHVSSLSIKSFKMIYPHLKPGGLYVVEDLHLSYQSFYYGVGEANPNPDATGTAMSFFKRLADEVNFDPAGPGTIPCTKRWNLFPSDFWMGFHLESVSFFRDCVFIVKHPDA